jgi:hypothetical protein
MLNHCERKRSGECGQVLVMALAFIAFFGMLTAAVLAYADATDLQKAHIERSSMRNSLAEGGAAWAAADASTGTLSCSSGGQGSLTMEGGDTVTYRTNTNGCNPGVAPGAYCSLCLLGSGSSPNPATAILNTQSAAQLTVNGEVDINGSLSGGPLVSIGLNQGIRLLRSCDTNGSPCSTYPAGTTLPTPTNLASPFADPLAGWLLTNKPSASGSAQTVNVNGATEIENPGVYQSITATNHAIVTLTSGVYIITGTIDISDHSILTSLGPVVLYLACPTSAPTWTCSATGQVGGAIKIYNNADVTLIPYVTGQYAGVSLFADPNLTDPSSTGWSNCASSTSCPVIYAQNNTASFSGTVYMHSGSIYVTSNATLSIGGRVIARAMTGVDNVNLNLLGPGPAPCPVFDDSVSGTAASSSSTGRAIVQAGCNGHYGIVDFNYLP